MTLGSDVVKIHYFVHDYGGNKKDDYTLLLMFDKEKCLLYKTAMKLIRQS